LAAEQEEVQKKIENILLTLNTDLVHASTLGMLVQLKEEFIETVGEPVPLQMLSVVRVTAIVGFRKEP